MEPSGDRNARRDEKMITVWEWTGIILLIYSGVLVIAGLIYEPKVFSVNTSLVWGIFVFLFSVLMIYAGRRSRLTVLLVLFGVVVLSRSEARELEREFRYPHPSVEGTGGLFRLVSPRAVCFRTFSIGTYLGFFNTSDDSVLFISRDYFALKERKERVMFEVFNSTGVFNYMFVSFGMPSLRPAGILTGDLSLTLRNSSIFMEHKVRGRDLTKDNVQSFGDLIITPKVSYTLEARFLSFSLWSKVYLLSRYREQAVGAVSVAPGVSAVLDANEIEYFRRSWRYAEALNPKLYGTFSYNFDNSPKAVPSELREIIPSFVKTAMMIEPYDQIQTGIGIELGDSKKGIGRYVSGFLEWYLYYYFPSHQLATFGSMPQYFSVGARFKPIPLISMFLMPIPKEIEDATFFFVADFNVSSVVTVPFEIGPTVTLRNSYPWALFFGLNIFWNPWEKEMALIRGEGGRLKIRVVDSETMLPLGDTIVSYPGLDLSNQSTDPSSGEVVSYELPPGEWEITFRRTGYEPQALKIRVDKGIMKEVEVAMVKQRGVAMVFGSVRSAVDGSPVPARLELEGANLPPFFSRPQDGSYEISVPPGSYKLRISSQGYNPVDISLRLSAGDRKRYDVMLEPLEEVIQRKAEVLLKVPERKITLERETNSILLPEKILFDDVTDDVLSTSVELIRELSDFIKKELPNKKIVIEVHTSPIKDPREDRIKTQRRAEKIASLLERYGVSRENLIPVGKGSDFPIFSNDTPEGRAGNRRVYFFIQE